MADVSEPADSSSPDASLSPSATKTAACLNCGAKHTRVTSEWCGACWDERERIVATGAEACCVWYQTASASKTWRRQCRGDLYCRCECPECETIGKHAFVQCYNDNPATKAEKRKAEEDDQRAAKMAKIVYPEPAFDFDASLLEVHAHLHEDTPTTGDAALHKIWAYTVAVNALTERQKKLSPDKQKVVDAYVSDIASVVDALFDEDEIYASTRRQDDAGLMELVSKVMDVFVMGRVQNALLPLDCRNIVWFGINAIRLYIRDTLLSKFGDDCKTPVDTPARKTELASKRLVTVFVPRDNGPLQPYHLCRRCNTKDFVQRQENEWMFICGNPVNPACWTVRFT